MVDVNFRKIPKIELHAHLGGSVRVEALRQYGYTPPPYHNLDTAFELFKVIHKYMERPERLKEMMIGVLKDFESDGVVYLELRSTPRCTEFMSKREYVQCILQVIEQYQGNMIIRYLVSIDQSKSKQEMEENASIALEFSTSPFVCGVDLSGDVSGGKENVATTIDILRRCKDAGLKLACHIAETAEISLLQSRQLLELQPDRLGHATFLDIDSSEGQLVRDRKIIIECCLTSNILTKTVATYDSHHFAKWKALQHPVLVCTDDAGVFNTSLSEEYKLAVQHYGMTVDDLNRMNLRAVDYIFDDSVKKSLRLLLQTQQIV